MPRSPPYVIDVNTYLFDLGSSGAKPGIVMLRTSGRPNLQIRTSPSLQTSSIWRSGRRAPLLKPARSDVTLGRFASATGAGWWPPDAGTSDPRGAVAEVIDRDVSNPELARGVGVDRALCCFLSFLASRPQTILSERVRTDITNAGVFSDHSRVRKSRLSLVTKSGT
jgi:hypothetical protein